MSLGLIALLFPAVVLASTFNPQVEFEMRPLLRSLALELALNHPTGEDVNELELSDEDVLYCSELRLNLVDHLETLPTNIGLIEFARKMLAFHAQRLANGGKSIPAHNDMANWASEYLNRHGGGITLLNLLRSDYQDVRRQFSKQKNKGALSKSLFDRYEVLIAKIYNSQIYEIPDYNVRHLSDSQITVVQQRVEELAESFLEEAEQSFKNFNVSRKCARLLVANDNTRFKKPQR